MSTFGRVFSGFVFNCSYPLYYYFYFSLCLAMTTSAEQSGANGSVDVTFKDDVAILTMNCGENRFNELFVSRMHEALDKVLR